MTEKTDRQTRIRLVAHQLALLYPSKYEGVRACACTGLSAVCLDCAQWWQMFLEEMTEQKLEQMLELYQFAEDMASKIRKTWDCEQ